MSWNNNIRNRIAAAANSGFAAAILLVYNFVPEAGISTEQKKRITYPGLRKSGVIAVSITGVIQSDSDISTRIVPITPPMQSASC